MLTKQIVKTTTSLPDTKTHRPDTRSIETNNKQQPTSVNTPAIFSARSKKEQQQIMTGAHDCGNRTQQDIMIAARPRADTPADTATPRHHRALTRSTPRQIATNHNHRATTRSTPWRQPQRPATKNHPTKRQKHNFQKSNHFSRTRTPIFKFSVSETLQPLPSKE